MVGESLIAYLAAEGIGILGSTLWLGSQPDSPDNCITIYEESAPTLDESHAFNIDTAGIQVLVRNTNYLAAKNKAGEVHQKVSGFRMDKFSATGPWIRQTHIVTAPASIGQDERDRHEWTIHYTFEYLSEGNEHRTSS